MKPSLSSSMEQQGTNITINCADPEDIEPFDAELLARVQSLHQEIEQKTLEITSLRRSTPMEAALLFQQSCTLTDDATQIDPETSTNSASLDPAIEIAREREISETFTKGVKMLNDLKKSVPATSAKVERTKDVVSHVYS